MRFSDRAQSAFSLVIAICVALPSGMTEKKPSRVWTSLAARALAIGNVRASRTTVESESAFLRVSDGKAAKGALLIAIQLAELEERRLFLTRSGIVRGICGQ